MSFCPDKLRLHFIVTRFTLMNQYEYSQANAKKFEQTGKGIFEDQLILGEDRKGKSHSFTSGNESTSGYRIFREQVMKFKSLLIQVNDERIDLKVQMPCPNYFHINFSYRMHMWLTGFRTKAEIL